MGTTLTIFIVFAFVICLFCVTLVTREMIVDMSDRRQKKSRENDEMRKEENRKKEAEEKEAALREMRHKAELARLEAEIAHAEADKADAERRKKAPAEEAPVEKAPAEEAPVEKAPAEEAPVEKAPAEEAPVEKAPAEEAPVEKAPAEEAPAEEAPVEKAPAEENNDGVWISGVKKQTLEEKYLELDSDSKSYYDELVRYANQMDGTKRIKNASYEEYKIGNRAIIRLTVKRGAVHAQFVIVHEDFRNYISENKVSVKTAPTVIKIDSPDAVSAAKSSMDIALSAVRAEQEYKKEKQREKRRERNRQNAEALKANDKKD